MYVKPREITTLSYSIYFIHIRCEDINAAIRRRRKRAVLNDIIVDVTVSSPTIGTSRNSLSDLRRDVDSLADDILALAATNMTITLGGGDEQQTIESNTRENHISNNLIWTCNSGQRSTADGCGKSSLPTLEICPIGQLLVLVSGRYLDTWQQRPHATTRE